MPNPDSPLYYLKNTEIWESGIITIVNNGMQEHFQTTSHTNSFRVFIFVEIDCSAL